VPRGPLPPQARIEDYLIDRRSVRNLPGAESGAGCFTFQVVLGSVSLGMDSNEPTQHHKPGPAGGSGRPDGPRPPISIPDHELIRCIGRGSYGEVWLARNTMGVCRAVKVVYLDSFTDQRPFEREWSGIRKFEPVSRSHQGFIDVLHVGINKDQGHFYYVMELGDDQASGQAIDPDRYQSKTLGSEISQRGRLTPHECLQLGLALSEALFALHELGLVHRDVKPSNIIFVNGMAKLADIGLVANAHEALSIV